MLCRSFTYHVYFRKLQTYEIESIFFNHTVQLNKRLILTRTDLKKIKRQLLGAWRLLQYCQFRNEIPAIFCGMFRIFSAISNFFLHFFHDSSRNTGRQTLTCAVIKYSTHRSGVPGGAIGWGTTLQAGISRVPSPMVSLESFIDIILLAALWLWCRLSL